MPLKANVSALKVGQKVWAIIEETILGDEIIVNFHGDLLKVKNQSRRHFRTGQRIQLNVTSIYPLQFQLLEARRLEKSNTKIDLSI